MQAFARRAFMLWLFLVPVALDAGPISPYYIVSGSNKNIRIFQGNKLTGSFTLKSQTFALAVTDAVRTYPYLSGFGSEYSLAGVYTGVDYPLAGSEMEALDGATDGSDHNYLINFADKGIYQFDFDWTDPVLLFKVPTTPTGITFDQTSGHLWISRDVDKVIEEYTLDGKLLTSFSYGATPFRLGALAWEPATDTLWGFIWNGNEFRQFDKTGKLLEKFSVLGPPPQLAFGGEFALSPLPPPAGPPEDAPSVATPEPASIVLLAGMGIAIALDWRRRRKATHNR